jgi:multicomponent Na+:H+ antiporter subunit B
MMVTIVDIVLLVLLAGTALTIVRLRNLFAATMLMGIYSLLSAGLFVTMDAMDVAFTEAAVGAGVSTVLMLGTLALVGSKEQAPRHRQILPLFVTVVTGAILVYGSLDMPPFGDPSNPVHQHVAPYYLDSYEDTHIPNVVTTVLGSYRGFDTMGETAVVFTALVGVLLLLGSWGGRGRAAEGGPGPHPSVEDPKRSGRNDRAGGPRHG